MKKQPDPTNATNPVQRERTPVRSVRTPVANRNAEKPAAPTRNGPAALVEPALLTRGSALAPGALAFAIETNAIVTPTMPVSAPASATRASSLRSEEHTSELQSHSFISYAV